MTDPATLNVTLFEDIGDVIAFCVSAASLLFTIVVVFVQRHYRRQIEDSLRRVREAHKRTEAAQQRANDAFRRTEAARARLEARTDTRSHR